MESVSRLVKVDLPEDVVVDLLAVLHASAAPVKAVAIPALTRALPDASARRPAPKRLAVFHAFCDLSAESQQVVADLVFWLRRWNPRSRRQLRASLDALARHRVVSK